MNRRSAAVVHGTVAGSTTRVMRGGMDWARRITRNLRDERGASGISGYGHDGRSGSITGGRNWAGHVHGHRWPVSEVGTARTSAAVGLAVRATVVVG